MTVSGRELSVSEYQVYVISAHRTKIVVKCHSAETVIYAHTDSYTFKTII